MDRKCQDCGEPASKRCASCTVPTAWYCSSQCQRRNWVEHIFECNPRRNITTADYLALAIHKKMFPDDPQTCQDFGFTKAFSIENQSRLLGLYVGLIERLKISPKTVRQWQLEGTLIDNIKTSFSSLPAQSRGSYYPWFLRNQWVLDPRLSPPQDPVNDTMVRCWEYVRGGPNTDTPNKISAEMHGWPEEKHACYSLCNLILSQTHPSPELDIWVKFGFCACHDEEEERILAGVYTQLIKHKRCTFEQLYHAYLTSGLMALFSSRGLQLQTDRIPHLSAILERSPKVFPSVCYLKQFVAAQGETSELILSVAVDYGFRNCENEHEKSRLKELYKQVFTLPRPRSDLMRLHHVCIQGKLYNHIGQLIKLRKDEQKLFKRLLRNPYPMQNM
ncbi:MYND-type domain-containing protein [Favolaschia claudopus]|uniref:MYND-type domain-containing protein n=1 Tax=Favolaschia claudopus TaxID=2862362 RepID=A0AAW0EGH1_9AGAR